MGKGGGWPGARTRRSTTLSGCRGSAKIGTKAATKVATKVVTKVATKVATKIAL